MTAAIEDRPIRLAVLISGGGTTLVNFLQKIELGELNAEIPLVIANKTDCGGIQKAEAAGLRCDVVLRSEFSSTDDFSKDIFDRCRDANVDLVTLAGFLSFISIPDDFESRVMNIHPSLIPAFSGSGFYGHHVHEAVVERGVKISGCTVHFADNEYDHGPVILQKSVDIIASDTSDDVAAKVFKQECKAYPEAIRLFAAGKLRIEGRRVFID